ncbi:hypothetical protein PF010_g6124 [Phytophthora fragariae]|uniref:Uncharacterized protein n=1 Tax=Phytophthora fragariae TaxID=53985 RepID=A0A6A3U7P4_9STRA|nr:hypothetical protein PF010_g6124 [Phytophthora fragariae]KAE9128163.1 hypothetical protein PF007_g5356 [Phytophthora fragariae]KAE9147561.1 hypothetical protein PF006_g7777 [Phytophthora fragariae]KAE9207085.1 hypothetical protein PF004_g17122 [Phytophthora fragariae]KAE9214150.1 hypothetical protein PF002_g17751 [Phytophthora fragariae]
MARNGSTSLDVCSSARVEGAVVGVRVADEPRACRVGECTEGDALDSPVNFACSNDERGVGLLDLEQHTVLGKRGDLLDALLLLTLLFEYDEKLAYKGLELFFCLDPPNVRTQLVINLLVEMTNKA